VISWSNAKTHRGAVSRPKGTPRRRCGTQCAGLIAAVEDRTPGTPDDVRVQIEYLTDLCVTAEAALSSVDLAATMAPVDTRNVRAVFRV
jgi:hypothetical protein